MLIFSNFIIALFHIIIASLPGSLTEPHHHPHQNRLRNKQMPGIPNRKHFPPEYIASVKLHRIKQLKSLRKLFHIEELFNNNFSCYSSFISFHNCHEFSSLFCHLPSSCSHPRHTFTAVFQCWLAASMLVRFYMNSMKALLPIALALAVAAVCIVVCSVPNCK